MLQYYPALITATRKKILREVCLCQSKERMLFRPDTPVPGGIKLAFSVDSETLSASHIRVNHPTKTTAGGGSLASSVP